VNGPHVLIHYVGWGDEWDDVIDTSVESRRIRPAGSQLPRRSPSKNKRLDALESSNPSAASATKQSQREDELLVYKERRKSSSSIEEQRRGSFTHPTSRGTDQAISKVRQKIVVQHTTQPSIPESELLTELDDTDKVKRKSRTQQSSSLSQNSARSTGDGNGNGSYHPTRELSRNNSDPGTRLNQNSSHALSPGDEEAIPSEVDESEYYETLRIETAFFEAMNAKGYHIVEMDGDGNCLFRSIAHQIYLDEDRHQELRLRCVQHLEKHSERFSSFYPGDFREYLRRMKRPGVWGDDLEIKALEEITDRLIQIYSSHSNVIEPLITNFDEKEIMTGVQPILLSYHGKNHYNSVYDERTSLPLERRRSQTLLKIRSQAYENK
jgi:hypothetical protein